MAKILLIDDSSFQRKIVRGFLEEAGHVVEECFPLSALEIVERLRASAPELVITDYAMPHVNGETVVQMLRRESKTLPAIMLSASRDPAREAKLRTMGIRRILYKPIAGPALVQVVEEILAGRG